ncbi:response regulator transcription factor [Pararhodobacter zhoushanensis]|uniref:Response regulator n=1 Tax=Pararhodobacter zhoushanensis TaxID=2479545 RepID=A0ABT3GZL5_9RHOB|nr:response regulator [Pararhodobacter zhoushanensis]MCW1932994.1 response regulator [Pararhodobacter zhoushanensis]
MEHDGTAPSGTAAVTSPGSPGTGGGRSVLVVEDEPNISEAIRYILKRDGWAVTLVDSGAEALDFVTTARPSVMILDVMLPGVSGFDILHALRSRPETEDLPVIVLTAKGSVAVRDTALQAGASRFMAKPFANAELLAAVRQLAGL